MEIEFFGPAIDDFEYWRTSGNLAVQKKINQLLTSMLKTPFEGLGKPEALKHNLSGKWSRRINSQHRIVYEVVGD
jgi:toxin YoeB